MHLVSSSDGHLSRFTVEISSLFWGSTLSVRFLALLMEGKASFHLFYCTCDDFTVNALIPNLKSLKKCDFENPS